MCVCNSTGPTLVWDTSISGEIPFGAPEMAGATGSAGEFTAVLTERANGMSSSTLMFNPSTVRAAAGPVTVTCDDIASLVTVINTTNITVTSAGNNYFVVPRYEHHIIILQHEYIDICIVTGFAKFESSSQCKLQSPQLCVMSDYNH